MKLKSLVLTVFVFFGQSFAFANEPQNAEANERAQRYSDNANNPVIQQYMKIIEEHEQEYELTPQKLEDILRRNRLEISNVQERGSHDE